MYVRYDIRSGKTEPLVQQHNWARVSLFEGSNTFPLRAMSAVLLTGPISQYKCLVCWFYIGVLSRGGPGLFSVWPHFLFLSESLRDAVTMATLCAGAVYSEACGKWFWPLKVLCLYSYLCLCKQWFFKCCRSICRQSLRLRSGRESSSKCNLWIGVYGP